METIFGITAPSGACKVRLTCKFARQGGKPAITCETLTEEALQQAIDTSESLKKYLDGYGAALKLGKPPLSLKGELQFLGSDGGGIDEPQEVEFTYYGDGSTKKKKGKGALRLALRMVRSSERVQIEREKTRQEELKQLGEIYRGAAQTAAEEAAKLLAAGAEPLKLSVTELANARREEHTRANDATKDVATLLERQAQPPPPQSMTEKLKDISGAVLPWVPVVKSFFGPN